MNTEKWEQAIYKTRFNVNFFKISSLACLTTRNETSYGDKCVAESPTSNRKDRNMADEYIVTENVHRFDFIQVLNDLICSTIGLI